MNDHGESIDQAEAGADGADMTLREHLDRTHASLEEQLQEARTLLDLLCEEHERQRQAFLDHLATDHAAPAVAAVATAEEAQRVAAEQVEEWHEEAQQTLQEAQETLAEAQATAEQMTSAPSPSSEEPPSASTTAPEPEESSPNSPTSSEASPPVEILTPPAPVVPDEQRQNSQRRAERRRSIANPTARRMR
jgi:ABC-type transporter Mla subunit MlaD